VLMRYALGEYEVAEMSSRLLRYTQGGWGKPELYASWLKCFKGSYEVAEAPEET
jgi:hypothetical protein